MPAWARFLRDFFLGMRTEDALRAAIAPHADLGKTITASMGIEATGYSVAADRAERVARLRSLGMEAVTNPAFLPRDGKTYCNLAARFVAQGMGCFQIPANMLANQMLDFLAHAEGWREDSLERGHAAACRGGLAFVGAQADPHGHILSMAPEPKQWSGTWGDAVPLGYNVGRSNGLMKLSQAFKKADRPRLRTFVWEKSLV